MNWIDVQIQLVAAVVAVACALPGVFLVLRRLALLSDAISHAVVLGIVVALLVTRDLYSPWLVLGAALSGLVLVALVELVERTRLVREDAAIGLVFPLLFSLGILLMTRLPRDVHVDPECVVFGSLEQVPLLQWSPWGNPLGPKALYLMSAILLANLAFVIVFFKELKITTFDPGLAAALGFFPSAIHYALMTLVSITVVGAFDAVGAVLVLAFMIAPPATAYLLTQRLSFMILLSALFAVLSAVSGYWLAKFLNSNIAGSMASIAGSLFAGVLLLSPGSGIIAQLRLRARQRFDFAQTMLAIHLLNHQDQPDSVRESRVDHLQEHLGWTAAFAGEIIRRAQNRGLITLREERLFLTDAGSLLARQALDTL